MFICFVLLPLSASQSCPDESKCSSGTSTLPDTQPNFGNDTHVLDLSCQRIKNLEPEIFGDKDVTNITSVHLNDNCINEVIPYVFTHLVALRHLYLQNNQINYLHPSVFQSNVFLITLDLGGNKLNKLDSIIFQKNSNLIWVNITGNPLNASATEPTLFNLSLNTIDIDNCNNAENSINYFQAIPYLRGLNLKENAVFTVKTLTSYQNTNAEEMSLEKYVLPKLLKSGYNDSAELRYDGIQKVIFGPSNTSLMCFCNRLSAWFWCFEQPLLCLGHSADIYSLLNCSVTPLLPTSSSSSAPALSTTSSAEAATTDDTNFATDTSTSNKYPEPETAGNNVTLYVILGVGILIVIIVIIICIAVIIVVRLRRRNNVTEKSVRYTSVSRDNSETTSYITYDEPHYRRDYNAESHTYSIPYVHNKFTTFNPSSSISARGDNIRRGKY